MGNKHRNQPASKPNPFLASAQQSAVKVDTTVNRKGEPIFEGRFPIEKIKLYESQVRDRAQLSTDESTLEEMTDSIKNVGLLQPVLLRKVGHEHFLVAGERRYRSVLLAGEKTIQAIIRVMSDEECQNIQIHENIHRANLSQADMARALERAKEQGADIDAILKKWGKTKVWASKIKIFIDETPAVRAAIEQGVTSDQQVLGLVKKVAENDEKAAEELVEKLGKQKSNQRRLSENVLAEVKAKAGKKALSPKRVLELAFEQLANGEAAADVVLSLSGDKSGALLELEQIFSDARKDGAEGLMQSLKSREFAADGAGAIRLATYLSGMTEARSSKFSLIKALALVKP